MEDLQDKILYLLTKGELGPNDARTIINALDMYLKTKSLGED